MSTISCFCGNVCIRMASRPLGAVECCCCDCQNTLQWCREQQSMSETNSSSSTTISPSSPPLLHYIDNDILEVTGEEYLQLFQLRHHSATIRVVSHCCSSFLLNLHWLYMKRRIMVLPQACCLEYEGDPVLAYCRIQTKFWNHPLNTLPPLESGGPDLACDNPLWLFQSDMLRRIVFPKLPPRQGETFHDVMERLQQRQDHHAMIVAGIDEPPLEGHFQTGLGMFSLTFRNPFVFANHKQQAKVEEEEQESSS